MSSVKVAAVQMSCSEDREENISKAERMIRSAAAEGANIILLPELFELPYFCQEKNYDYYYLADKTEDNPAVKRFKQVAKETGTVIPVSFYEKYGNAFFNTIAMIDADGSLMGIYRKSHIPDDHFYQEKFYFTPGDTGFKVEYEVRLYRSRNMLGSMVPRSRTLYVAYGRRYAALPYRYRK